LRELRLASQQFAMLALVLCHELLYLCLHVAKAEIPESRRRTQKRQPKRRRIAVWLMLFGASVFVVDSLVGDRGLLAMLRARRQYQQLAATITAERGENARLRGEVRRLREDPRAVEEIARRDLGLMKAGEKVFIIRDVQPPTK
jgi:cell division protein FtsB